MAARSVRAGAEKAALAALRQDLQQRAALVGAAAETQARIAAVFADLHAAIAAHEQAYAAAVQGGWPREKLRELGVQEDPAGRAVRRALPPQPAGATDGGATTPVATASESRAAPTAAAGSSPA